VCGIRCGRAAVGHAGNRRGAHVTRLLVPADAEGKDGANLAAAITWAARGDTGVQRTVVRPANIFGVRLKARVAACGPPRAALLVFE
jgi:hypothetical protein